MTTSPRSQNFLQRRSPTEVVVRVLAAAALGYSAYVHLLLAGGYDANRGTLLSQGDLFRIEAVAMLVAALAVLLVRRRGTDVVVLVLAVGAVAAVLVYRYIDFGPIAGLPPMYEPNWYPEKILSAVAEAVAALAAAVLLYPTRPRTPG